MSDGQRPSVGRIVHFYTPDAPGRPFAAVITDTLATGAQVSSETHVHLHTFGRVEFTDEDEADVPYSETPTKRARWCWPPRV